MFSGAAFAFFAWDLTEFQQRLKRLPPRDDVDGMLRRHLIRIVRRRCIRHPVCHICRAHHEADKEEKDQKWMSIALFRCSFSSDCHEDLLWEMVISISSLWL